MKENIPINKAHRLINVGCVVLITSAFGKQENIMSLAWQAPLSSDPLLIGIAVARAHLTHELILGSREFAVNIPDWKMLDKVVFCGKNKGRKIDKIKGSGLKFAPATNIMAPLVDDCPANIECRVTENITVGDHTFFVGEVVRAIAQENLFDGIWQKGVELIHHLGGSDYYPGRPQ